MNLDDEFFTLSNYMRIFIEMIPYAQKNSIKLTGQHINRNDIPRFEDYKAKYPKDFDIRDWGIYYVNSWYGIKGFGFCLNGLNVEAHLPDDWVSYRLYSRFHGISYNFSDHIFNPEVKWRNETNITAYLVDGPTESMEKHLQRLKIVDK